MRKGREISGLPVIALSRGAKVGVVRDLVVDLDRRVVAGLLLAERTAQSSATLVPYEAIHRLGPDAVMVEDESAVVASSEHPRLQALCESPTRVLGLEVFTEGGRMLGTVSDLLVDERSGSIEQFEVSSGALRDVIRGRSYVPADSQRAVGEELMIVPEMARSERALLEQGPPPAVEVPPWAPLKPTARDLEQAAAELLTRQSGLILGMRARKTIANEDAGGLIVFEGETVGEETVEKAKAAGKLNLLVEASGEPAMAALALGLEQQYARLALGRMARRTVHSTKGEVILSQGDAVTPEAVQKAQEAGVLDQLLEAARAREEGAAADRPEPREAARALWEQIGERLGWLTGRR